jgi:hypothetical protein
MPESAGSLIFWAGVGTLSVFPQLVQKPAEPALAPHELQYILTAYLVCELHVLAFG